MRKLYRELMTSVKATMTDQGPTMPQFSERIAAIREDLLPSVVGQWDTLPPEVQATMKEFGTFYCKMHPLINCVDEVNKTHKSYEDIATQGKNEHTLLTHEAGVTRLIRTASKGFHKFPDKLFCIACEKTIDHPRPSLLDNHLEGAKHLAAKRLKEKNNLHGS